MKIPFFDKTKNSDYTFDEENHIYYWRGKRVNISVTKFIQRYFSQFNTDLISKKYATAHGLSQEEVKKQWEDAGNISAMAGTIIHSILENSKNNLPINEDYSNAEKAGLLEEVKEKVVLLKPKAERFLLDTKELLIPLATEYTVGLEDKLAGNIDLLAWNTEANEIQIWDYKNTKQISKDNKYANCFEPFSDLPDCNFGHYSLQLSFYKALAQKLLNIKIGKMYLVHFNSTTKKDNYTVYEVKDFSDICSIELDKLLIKKPIINNTPQYVSNIRGPVPF